MRKTQEFITQQERQAAKVGSQLERALAAKPQRELTAKDHEALALAEAKRQRRRSRNLAHRPVDRQAMAEEA